MARILIRIRAPAVKGYSDYRPAIKFLLFGCRCMELVPVMVVPEFVVVIVYHKILPVGENFLIIFRRQAVCAGHNFLQYQFPGLGGVV